MRDWVRAILAWLGLLTLILLWAAGGLKRRLYPGWHYMTREERWSRQAVTGRLRAYAREVRRMARNEREPRLVIITAVSVLVMFGGMLIASIEPDLPYFVGGVLALVVWTALGTAIVGGIFTAFSFSWPTESVPRTETLPERLNTLSSTLELALTTMVALEVEIRRRQQEIAEIEEQEALGELNEREREAVARKLEGELRKANASTFRSNLVFFVAGVAISWFLSSRV